MEFPCTVLLGKLWQIQLRDANQVRQLVMKRAHYAIAILALAALASITPAMAAQDNSTGGGAGGVPHGNGTQSAPGQSRGNNTEHDMPDGVRYFDNGTIITKMEGKASKFFLQEKVHFYPYGTPQTSGAPDPVVPCPPNNGTGSPYPYAILRSHCGLMEFDPLDNETMTQQQLEQNQQYWTYDGDAPQENATYAFYRDTQGLHIGAEAPANGTYAGYFAMSANTTASLFHSVITTPVRAIPSNGNYFQNGMYVQTAQANVNYATCVSITNNVGTVWAVVHTYGTANSAVKFDLLWMDNSPNQPLTRDCTIITNGSNYLRVYMDGQMVYTNSTLNLQMPMPLNAYLEPESSYAGQILYGTYNDYYETSGDMLGISSVPAGSSEAKILDRAGNLVASSPVSGSNASIDIGRFHDPINGTLVITGTGNGTVASAPNFYNIFGGDNYTVVVTPKAPQQPANLSATAVSPTQIDLSWSPPAGDGGSPITGYMIERLQGNSTTWSTAEADSNSTATTYSDTGLATGVPYTYRVSAINSVGAGTPSNSAYAIPYSILTLSKSGLVASDPLNQTENEQKLLAGQSFWTFNGSAPEENASYNVFEDSEGFMLR